MKTAPKRLRRRSASPADSDGAPPSEQIADALELRRAKKRSAGVEAAALGAGDPLVAKERRADEERRRKDAEDGAWKIKKGGLQTVLVAENAFAKPSNAMDTERKMQEFIERELRRKTMQQQQQSEGGSAESLVVGNSDGGDNTNDQDFGDNPKQEVSEGNVAFSAAMLTSIPVVDLGISTKLKNIEETERAKRDIISGKLPNPIDKLSGSMNVTASDRFYKGRPNDMKKHPHSHSSNEERKEPKERKFDRRTMATDDIVMDKFKKRNHPGRK